MAFASSSGILSHIHNDENRVFPTHWPLLNSLGGISPEVVKLLPKSRIEWELKRLGATFKTNEKQPTTWELI